MNWRPRLCLFAIVTLLTWIAACSQGSFSPTSPSRIGGTSSGAVITGTVMGLSSSMVTADSGNGAASTSFTVSVAGTQIASGLDSSGRFRLVGVPSGPVQLNFKGNGIDATLTLNVASGEHIDLTVRATNNGIRIEAERRENGRDDDDDEDEDDEDEDDDENEVKGLVSGLANSCPNITFNVGTVKVRADNATRFEDGTCAQVQNNVRVEVEGRRQGDGTLLATEIEIED